jgi:hypothetical protein
MLGAIPADLGINDTQVSPTYCVRPLRRIKRVDRVYIDILTRRRLNDDNDELSQDGDGV